MKVLITSHLFPNRVNPFSGIFIREQLRFIRDRCEVKLIIPTPWFPGWLRPVLRSRRWAEISRIPARDVWDGIEIIRPRYLTFPRMFLIELVGFFYFLALSKASGDLDFDLIHAHTAYPDGFGAAMLSVSSGRPLVVTVHGSDLKILPSRGKLRPLISWTLRRANAIIAVSSELKEIAVELGADPRKVTVVNNGVDTGMFSRAKRASSGSYKKVLYVGRFVREKGVGVLIEAASLVLKKRDDLRFLLVGRTKDGGDEFERMVSSLGIGDKVKLMDAVPFEEIPKLLSSSDIFVLPSFSEGFPLSIIEAMACGKPVVATKCGGPEQIVTKDVGVLIEPGDPRKLAEAISWVADHPNSYDPERISSMAKEKYDLGKLAGKIFSVYRAALAGGRPWA